MLQLSRSSVICEAEPCNIIKLYVINKYLFLTKSSKTIQTVSVFQPPPVCKHQLYCENAPNYPSNIVSRELKKNPHLRGYSSMDEVRKIFI